MIMTFQTLSVLDSFQSQKTLFLLPFNRCMFIPCDESMLVSCQKKRFLLCESDFRTFKFEFNSCLMLFKKLLGDVHLHPHNCIQLVVLSTCHFYSDKGGFHSCWQHKWGWVKTNIWRKTTISIDILIFTSYLTPIYQLFYPMWYPI